MNITQTTTLQQGQHASRDVGAHRRAYLDTYAKRRAGINPEAEAAQAAQTQPEIEKPAVIAVPISAPAMQQQMPVTAHPEQFTYTPTPAVAVPANTASTHVQTDRPTSRRARLDTMIQSHEQRVAQAPQALDTVTAPVLTEQTQHLIEPDIADEHKNRVDHQRISANLQALYNPKPLTEQIAKSKTSASASHIRTIVASSLACGILAVGIFAFTTKYEAEPVVAQPIGAPVIEVEAPVTSTPTGTPAVNSESVIHADPSDPVNIIISSIGVNARVDGLGTTPGGLIAVPNSYGTVGWYNKASQPGSAGPAVLVGHYTGGYGGVFDKLADVQDGDLITVRNGKGETFTYKVSKKAEYPKDQVPMADIFKKGDASRLEIITCSGKWQANNYDNRLVVTAELVQ